MAKSTITEYGAGSRGGVAGAAGAVVAAGAAGSSGAVYARSAAVASTGGNAPVLRTPRRLPGWMWFVALWCGGVGAAMLTGAAFKLLMNATLFAVAR